MEDLIMKDIYLEILALSPENREKFISFLETLKTPNNEVLPPVSQE